MDVDFVGRLARKVIWADVFFCFSTKFQIRKQNENTCSKTIPSDNFARLVDEWNKIFLQEFDKNVEKPNLISSMVEKVVQSIHCCIPWFPSSDACRGKLRTILSYFLRIRVYYVCKTMNQRLVDQKRRKKIANTAHFRICNDNNLCLSDGLILFYASTSYSPSDYRNILCPIT